MSFYQSSIYLNAVSILENTDFLYFSTVFMTIATSLTHAHTSLQLYLVRAIHKMCAISSYSRIDRLVSKDAVFTYLWL